MAKYIKLKDNYNPIPYSMEEFIEEFPGVDPCDAETQETSDEILARYNVYRLWECKKPIIPGNYVEGPPIYLEGKWIQHYIKPVPPPWEE